MFIPVSPHEALLNIHNAAWLMRRQIKALTPDDNRLNDSEISQHLDAVYEELTALYSLTTSHLLSKDVVKS